jgi:hypothetical protein
MPPESGEVIALILLLALIWVVLTIKPRNGR